MTDVYDDIVEDCATGSFGRWFFLALIVALFLHYTSEKRKAAGPDWPYQRPRPYHFLPFGELPMLQSQNSARVTVLPGHHESENLASRVLMAAILDFSGSMCRHAAKLPVAWRNMVTALGKQTTQRLRVELACCAFDHRIVFQDFAPLPFYLEQSLNFSGGGTTALGGAILTTIDRTRQRRETLAAEGIQCNRAVCPVLTDGRASDVAALQTAMGEIRRAEEAAEIEFIPLAPDAGSVGPLKTIFDKDPILLDEVDFDILFGAFTRSISSYSQSMPGFEPEAATLIRAELGHSFERRRRPGDTAQPRLPYHGE